MVQQSSWRECTVGVEARDDMRCACAWTSAVNEGRRRVRDRSVCAGERRRTGKGLDAYNSFMEATPNQNCPESEPHGVTEGTSRKRALPDYLNQPD
uniref:Uncharacterized protein n=1 Tax=Caenorhabditis japonica TaxID=281687 RepID=A0A8R1IVU7_CAEJA